MIRRVRLARTTPLRPGRPLAPGGRLLPRRRHAGPAARQHTDWPTLRALLWTRCGCYCEACGARMNPDGWHAHHRLPRSRGGQDTVANLVALHGGCHVVQPQAVHQRPAWAYDQGLLLHSGRVPELSPLILPDGRPVLLAAGGTYLEVA